jgi:hypothetical protein
MQSWKSGMPIAKFPQSGEKEFCLHNARLYSFLLCHLINFIIGLHYLQAFITFDRLKLTNNRIAGESQVTARSTISNFN